MRTVAACSQKVLHSSSMSGMRRWVSSRNDIENLAIIPRGRTFRISMRYAILAFLRSMESRLLQRWLISHETVPRGEHRGRASLVTGLPKRSALRLTGISGFEVAGDARGRLSSLQELRRRPYTLDPSPELLMMLTTILMRGGGVSGNHHWTLVHSPGWWRHNGSQSIPRV